MSILCNLFGHKPVSDPIYELSMPPAYNTFTLRCARCKIILKQVSQQIQIYPKEIHDQINHEPGTIHQACGKMIPYARDIMPKVKWPTGESIPAKYTLDQICQCYDKPDD